MVKNLIILLIAISINSIYELIGNCHLFLCLFPNAFTRQEGWKGIIA